MRNKFKTFRPLRTMVECLAPPGSGPPERQEILARKILLALFFLALFVRILSAARVEVIAPDGARFIAIARLLAAGDFRAALADSYHPLYAILIALFRPFVGGFETAAFAVPVLFSALTVLPLFGAVRAVFGRRAAFIAVAVFAFLPPFVRCGADTLSEGTFHFFLLLSLLLGITGFRTGNIWRLLLSGLSAGASYLTRPEGLGILLAFGMFTTFAIVAGLEKRKRIGVALSGLVLLAGFFLPAVPYIVHIRLETGRWDFSRKKTASSLARTMQGRFEGIEDEKPPDIEIFSVPQALHKIGKKLLANFYYVPALFCLVGLFFPWTKSPKRPWRWEVLLLTATLIWVAACFFLLRGHGYLSHRHTIPGTLFLLGHVGRGAVLLAEALGPLLNRVPLLAGRLSVLSAPRLLLACLAALALLAGLKENFRAYRWDKVFVREIGREIAPWEGIGDGMVGNLPRVSYYADRKHHPIHFGFKPENVLHLAKNGNVGLLVVELNRLRTWAPSLHKALFAAGGPPEGFTLANTWEIEHPRPKTLKAFRLR